MHKIASRIQALYLRYQRMWVKLNPWKFAVIESVITSLENKPADPGHWGWSEFIACKRQTNIG